MATSMRRFPGLLGAALLAALATAPRAAVVARAKAPSAAIQVEDLQSDIGRPDDFQKFVEGSRARTDGPADPRAFAPGGAGRAPSAKGLLSGPQAGLRPESASMPPVPAADGRKTPLSRSSWPGPDVPIRGMSAVLGLGFMLIATSLLVDMLAPAPERAPLPEMPLARPLPPAAGPLEFAPTLARVEAAARETPFIDVRMPAPTWRAISWPEQKLIERWDASREKSLGLASLTEWLDAQHGVEGVDVALLRAKLSRDA